jgi:hypothetical protein
VADRKAFWPVCDLPQQDCFAEFEKNDLGCTSCWSGNGAFRRRAHRGDLEKCAAAAAEAQVAAVLDGRLWRSREESNLRPSV